MKTIKLTRIFHREGWKVLLKFQFDKELQLMVRNFPGARYTNTHKGWTIPERNGLAGDLQQFFGQVASLDLSGLKIREAKKQTQEETAKTIAQALSPASAQCIHADAQRKIDAFCEWMKMKRYSEKTIKNYRNVLQPFFRWAGLKPSEVEMQHIEDFNRTQIVEKKFSIAYQRQFSGAIKLFYQNQEEKQIDTDKLERPRGGHFLPQVLSKDEVKRILEADLNIKHKCILRCIYAGGLRLGELLNLKKSDIDFDRKLVRIENGKGRKDRVVGLSENLAAMLKIYFEEYCPVEFVFEGQSGGKYSARSVQQIFARAVQLAGIVKPVSVHTLRHSYATHLLEAGTNLRYIQTLLGHKTPKTTMIYTHVAQSAITRVKSPLDDL